MSWPWPLTSWPPTFVANRLDPVVDRVGRSDRLGCFVDRLDRLHRLVDDFSIDSTWPISDRLGRLAAILVTTFCSCLLTGSWREKFCVQAPDAFPLPVPSGRPSFPFLLPPLNIFVDGSCDHKMRSMRPVAKLLWPLVELYQRHRGRENECGI